MDFSGRGTLADLQKAICCCMVFALVAGCDTGQFPSDANSSLTGDTQLADNCKELEALIEQLKAESPKYTDKHPGIIELRERISCASNKCAAEKNGKDPTAINAWCEEDIKELNGRSFGVAT